MANLDLRVADKYRLREKIGGGSFGAVYIGTHVDSGEEVAIKLEHISVDPSFLECEADIYRSLSGGAGIPRVHAYVTECEYNAMVFDLLGPSLEDLFNFCGRKFSLKTVLMLVDQLLCRLEYIHAHDVIHRDIKPENCLMGVGKQGNQVYVTDLGLATERRPAQADANTGRSLRPSLVGTARFASVNGHLGVVQHRCDDLESLGYMLLYFIRPSLPWQGLKAANHEQREELILEKKQTISVEELCEGLPRAFAAYFDYIRSLGFDDKPKYSYLRKIFRDLFVREGFNHDNVFDWTILKYLQTTE
ncbi:hypothetical protein HO173_003545 [Letharia columbiana]|uniref:non-specific serine/threonine protein kinase n=1 Tax=Letharia columbiana TaxID=112416 RepID=A0A8H6L7F1_9LECA|nr:uncharacterized protein HO173_003545 [Letharia columbiana]KAF6238265.1 hypothetical protein HO173_003545 [Letharia columbiana]